jgi:hypothetical protein
MVSEMGEMFNAMKAYKAEKRRENTVKAWDEMDLFVEAAGSRYQIRVMTEHHWNVVKVPSMKTVAQYWPSANKWQTLKTGKIHHGDHDKFRAALRDGRF